MSEDTRMVTLREIAERIGLDRVHTRRWILNRGYEFEQFLDPAAGNQIVSALPEEKAEEVIAVRAAEGFVPNSGPHRQPSTGYFYVVQPVRELDARRVKLGFAVNTKARLADYKIACPNATVLAEFPCKPAWEAAAIDAVAAMGGCKCIGIEVYEVDDLGALLSRCEAFFDLMPALGEPKDDLYTRREEVDSVKGG